MTTTPLQAKLLPTLEFLLEDWLGLSTLLERDRFADHSLDSVRDLMRAASTVAAEKYEPANRVIDDHEPTFDGTDVHLPKETLAAWEAFVALGVLPASHDAEHGGWQLPRTVDFATKIVFGASAIGISPATLTDANASLLLAHGTPAQQEVFAHRELSGRWTGTMCLSESQAGSSLSDVLTRAVPDGPDHDSDPLGPRYRVTGNKMWISGGEHDLAENIVHLVLAKVPGPDGTVDPSTKGISLFIVPKHVVDASGRIVERNDVSLIGLNHKLGYRGVPNTALAFGDGSHQPGGAKGALGYLVGQPGDGLRQMFHMMNAARVEIGLGAAALGYAGYEYSLRYARERLQGRPMRRGGKDATQPQVPIVEHADVKRMLLAQKAYAEGGLALGLHAARLLDDQRTGDDQQVADAGLLLEILTPIVKSWPSEWCLEGNSLAIQVLGGAGYTRDHPVEQYWRDNRLNLIHEGTHGIQAHDLLGRKVRMADGAALALLGDRITATADAARGAGLGDRADQLTDAWSRVVDAARRVWSTGDPWDALPNATAYLQAFGHVVLAWTWLDLGVAAAGSDHAEAPGKTAAMEYFFRYELPRVDAWLAVVEPGETYVRDLDAGVL